MKFISDNRGMMRVIDAILLVGVMLTLTFQGYQYHHAQATAIQEAKLKAEFEMRDYIELKSVLIRDTPLGETIYMHVIRDLHQDFPGYYSVTIRQAAGGAVVCATGDITINYRALDAQGDPSRLPEPLPLAYWAEGGSCTARIAQGLPIGAYAVETCHGHQFPPGHDTPQEICWTPLPVFNVF